MAGVQDRWLPSGGRVAWLVLLPGRNAPGGIALALFDDLVCSIDEHFLNGFFHPSKYPYRY